MTTPFLVFDDSTGSFVNVEDIQGCIATDTGSVVLLRNNPATIETPLSAREVLKRSSVIRYKRGLDNESLKPFTRGPDEGDTDAPIGVTRRSRSTKV